MMNPLRLFARNTEKATPRVEAIREVRHAIDVADTPSQKALVVLNHTRMGAVYAGTANPRAVAKRRARNKMARTTRQQQRKAAR